MRHIHGAACSRALTAWSLPKVPPPLISIAKKKGDVPVFSHFNMPEPLLTDPLLLEGTGGVEAAR